MGGAGMLTSGAAHGTSLPFLSSMPWASPPLPLPLPLPEPPVRGMRCGRAHGSLLLLLALLVA